jgi:protoheme IX farnesyltransferase
MVPEAVERLRPAAGLGSLRLAHWRASARDHVALTKPRIMSLLVLTAVCSMVAAAHGDPSPSALLGLALGGALACGGASALNHVIDRDIDRLMGPRTASRPIAAGRIGPLHGAIFGLVLSVLAFAELTAAVNLPAATLAVSGGLYYVVVYTLWLKRHTDQNIVIGGAAGAIPTLAGWAAARGSIGLGAICLFGIVLLWTPPHFWALALLLAPRYAAAQVPMMPVVRGEQETASLMFRYAIVLWLFSLVPGLVGVFGLTYSGAALLLGAVLSGMAWKLQRDITPRGAALLFHFSLLYLALLFVAVSADAVIR